MFEVLVREAAARFDLGSKALPLLQIVLHHMVGGGARGLREFLERFKTAGLGPTVQSWLGGGPAARPISNDEVNQVLGSSDGLISQLVDKLELDRDNTTSALAYLLPSLVGKLTPGGSLPSRIPAEIQALADAGKLQLETPVARVPVATSSGGIMKWLPWVIVVLAVLLALGYCGTRDRAGEPVPPAPESAAPAASDSADRAAEPMSEQQHDAMTQETGPVDGGHDTSVDTAPAEDTNNADINGAADAQDAESEGPSQPDGVAGDTHEKVDDSASEEDAITSDAGTEAAVSGQAAGAASAASEQSAVEALTVDGKPALNVYFSSGNDAVGADFPEHAADFLAYLAEHTDAQAVLSGFTDATGSVEVNEKLAANRALAVQAALVMAGVDEDRVVLEKPQQINAADGADATARRVEVTVRD